MLLDSIYKELLVLLVDLSLSPVDQLLNIILVPLDTLLSQLLEEKLLVLDVKPLTHKHVYHTLLLPHV